MELIVDEKGLEVLSEDVLYYIDKDFNDDEFLFFIIKEFSFIDDGLNRSELVGEIFFLNMKVKVLRFN